MTQKQFAAMVGVSLPLIKAVESGQYDAKEKLARKIALETGAVLGKNGKVVWLGFRAPVIENRNDALSSGKSYESKHRNLFKEFWETTAEEIEKTIERQIKKYKKLEQQ